jgi:hypothetical protein
MPTSEPFEPPHPGSLGHSGAGGGRPFLSCSPSRRVAPGVIAGRTSVDHSRAAVPTVGPTDPPAPTGPTGSTVGTPATSDRGSTPRGRPIGSRFAGRRRVRQEITGRRGRWRGDRDDQASSEEARLRTAPSQGSHHRILSSGNLRCRGATPERTSPRLPVRASGPGTAPGGKHLATAELDRVPPHRSAPHML